MTKLPRKGQKMTIQEYEKWMEEMQSNSETKHKLDCVRPMLSDICVGVTNIIKSLGTKLNIDPDGLLMLYARVMIIARGLGIEKIEKGDREND